MTATKMRVVNPEDVFADEIHAQNPRHSVAQLATGSVGDLVHLRRLAGVADMHRPIHGNRISIRHGRCPMLATQALHLARQAVLQLKLGDMPAYQLVNSLFVRHF